MREFEVIVALVLGGAGLTALSRRIGTPYPALVALAGAALALVPGTPTLVLDPDLALTLFVAPVLLDAAFDASPRDLRANWQAVAGLAIGAVGLTIAAVAIVARLLVPAMPWAVAVALGAIVAPPDAAAGRLVDLRGHGTIGDAAFQQIEQELDWEELDFQQATVGHQGAR